MNARVARIIVTVFGLVAYAAFVALAMWSIEENQ